MITHILFIKKKIHFVVHLLIILINNWSEHVSTGPVLISFVSLELNIFLKLETKAVKVNSAAAFTVSQQKRSNWGRWMFLPVKEEISGIFEDHVRTELRPNIQSQSPLQPSQ